MIKKLKNLLMPLLLSSLLLHSLPTQCSDNDLKRQVSTFVVSAIALFFVYKIGQYFNPFATVSKGNNYIVYKNNFWGNIYTGMESRSLYPSAVCNGTYIILSSGAIELCNNNLYIDKQLIKLSSTSSSYQTIEKSGITETKIMDIPDVTALDISRIGVLIIKQCSENEKNANTLTITTDKNLLPHLRVIINHSQLSLGLNNNVTIPNNIPVTFTALLQKITHLSADNNAQIHLETPIVSQNIILKADHKAHIKGPLITTQELHVKSEHHSLIEASIVARDIKVNSAHHSIIVLSGTTRDQHIECTHNAMYSAYDLITKCSTVNAEHKGDVRINTQELCYKATYNSRIIYKGNPQQITGTTKYDSKICKAEE